MSDEALLAKCRRLLLSLTESDTDTEFWEVSRAARELLHKELTPRLTPPAPAPRFEVGDPVWAFNGEPRVIAGMRWAQAMRRNDEPIDHEPPWLWFVDTVHPEDPEYKGCGSEWTYEKREEG